MLTTAHLLQQPRPYAFTCPACGAVVDLFEAQAITRCIYCLSPRVVAEPRDAAAPEPQFVLPFIVGRDAARARLTQWLQSRSWFAASGFSSVNIQSLRSVFVPAYLYNALATGSYSVSIGERPRGGNGAGDANTEWRALMGKCTRSITDVVMYASKGISERELSRVEPFDFRAMRRADPSMMYAWGIEQPSFEPQQCIELARVGAKKGLEKALVDSLPGDAHDGLTLTIDVERESADLVACPLWVLTLKWERSQPAVRLLVNGQTGSVGGDVPLGLLKVAAVMGGVLAAGSGTVFVVGKTRGWW